MYPGFPPLGKSEGGFYHLGTITHVTDATGTVVNEYSFDAFGQTLQFYLLELRRCCANGPFAGRGFTGHEHLTMFNLINMNGRLYDPLVGRFISPDNYVQAPGYTQSFNRYSYALNNPLIYTDPDGEFAWLAAGIFAAFTYFKTAYDNRDPVTGKWAWNPTKNWFGKDKNTAVVIGVNTNTSFSNVTGFTGIGVGPYMPAVAVNSNKGVGFGVYTPQGTDFAYPGVSQRPDNRVVNSAINDARKYGPLGQGDNYLGTANNWLNGAGYLSGGIGAFQIGMLDYRSSLSLSSKIGTFSKFSSTYRLLGTTGKILGGASTYVGAPLSIGLDYSAMQNGQISDGLFAYRTTGTLSSIGGGALIGSAYGGPWGAAGGALIGTGFVAGEYIYNGANYIWNETLWQISNFENAIKSGWYPGR